MCWILLCGVSCLHQPIVSSESMIVGWGQTNLSHLYFSRLSLAMLAKLNFFKTPTSEQLVSSRSVSTSTGISGCFQPGQAKVGPGPTPLVLTPKVGGWVLKFLLYVDSMQTQTRLPWEGVRQFTRTAVNMPRYINYIKPAVVFAWRERTAAPRSLTPLLHAVLNSHYKMVHAGLLVVSDWYGRDGRGDGGHYHAPSAQGSQGWNSHTANPCATGT
jgi:hypothetical protein